MDPEVQQNTKLKYGNDAWAKMPPEYDADLHLLVQCTKLSECDPPNNLFMSVGFDFGVFSTKRADEETVGKCSQKRRFVSHRHWNKQRSRARK